MKKMVTLLMMLVVIVFTSACSGSNTTANSSQTCSKNLKKIEAYLSNYDNYSSGTVESEANSERYIADFDFNQYLLDSGAVEIKRIEDRQDSETRIAVRYPNNIITLYGFRSDRNDPFSYGWLDSINIFVAEESCDLDVLYNGTSESEFGIHSDWTHLLHMYESDYGEGRDNLYVVKPEKIYYIYGSDGQKNFLAIHEFFPDVFQNVILPYINLKDPSYVRDPFDGKIEGDTNYD